MTIGERIRARRKDFKLTQRDLAKALKISHVSVSQWERDDSEPTGKNLFSLGKLLQCSPAWLLFGDDEQHPSEPAEPPLLLSESQKELLTLFDALPKSEQDAQLVEMRARVENFENLFQELLEARKRQKK